MVALLRGMPKTGRYVFPGKTPNKPINNFRKALKTAVLRADIRRHGQPVNVTAHSLRRAHATWQAMRGVNESVLQSLLGHAPGSRITKQHYVHATEQAKRDAVMVLPFREQKEDSDAPDLATSGNTENR